MQEFLTGETLQAAVREVLKSEDVRCAVAFWGQGAQEWFGETVRTARLICNLNVGGTNPKPIQNLRKDARFELRQCDILHAKVYIGDHSAVVTSANISANGLGIEGASANGWIEAGVLLTDANELRKWFDDLWNNSAVVRPITDSDLRKAAKLRQSPAPRPRYVVIWSDDLTDSGMRAWEDAQIELGKKFGCYEDWDEIPAGADLFDFQISDKSVIYHGCWQTFDPQLPWPTNKKGGQIKLCQRKRGDHLGDDLKTLKNWKSIIRKLYDEKGQCVLPITGPILAASLKTL